MNITDKFYYKSDILDLLDLDENVKYSLLYVYFKFKDLINDKNYRRHFQLYMDIDLYNDDKLINFIFKNFTLKYKFNSIDEGNIVKHIII